MDDVVQTDENGIRSSVKPMVISQQDLESGEWSYQLIRNKEWYEMVAKPVEKLNRLIGYMIVGFVTAGILLFGILTSLSVKGRKREIGILLSMGGTQKKDFRTVRFGEFGSGFDCPGFCGAVCDTNSRVFRRSDDFESG